GRHGQGRNNQGTNRRSQSLHDEILLNGVVNDRTPLSIHADAVDHRMLRDDPPPSRKTPGPWSARNRPMARAPISELEAQSHAIGAPQQIIGVVRAETD